MKLILIIFLSLCLHFTGMAQAHNMGANYNCKRKKGNSFNSEKNPCPGCEAKENKENVATSTETKRNDKVILHKAKTDKDAKDKAAKSKQVEDAKNAKSGEAYIEMPKSSKTLSNPNKTVSEENRKYTFVQDNNNPKEPNREYFQTKHPVRILHNGKTIFESNDFHSLRKPEDTRLIFVLQSASNISGCKGEESNNSILVNEKGIKIPLPGIDKFGIFFSNRESDDFFDIAVFTGQCTPVTNDRYAKGDFHTIKYTFSYSTMQLISSKPSWQHADCNCE